MFISPSKTERTSRVCVVYVCLYGFELKKAQSVLGMVNRHFKDIDKEDFGCIYKTYVRPHLEYCIQAWSPHLKKR